MHAPWCMETNHTQTLSQFASLVALLETRNYTPHPKQQELHRDSHRYKVIRCGRRFGKTVFAVNYMIEQAVLKPGDYWFVAPTYRQAKEIAWRLLLGYLPAELIRKKNETELSVDLVTGSRIALKGADNPDSLRGVKLHGVVLDEYAFTDPYAWDVIRPILADVKGWAIFISTPNGYNHFYELYLAEIKNENYKSYHFTSYDNPYLDPQEIDDARATMSEERFAQEFMAEFTKRAGTIWPFSRDQHIKPKRNPTSQSVLYGSIDFGFAIGHPTAVLWHEVTSEEVFTFDGFVEEGMTIDRINEMMRAQTNGLVVRGIFADSARPDLIEELKQKGWNVMPADKDVELGIAKVGEHMQVNPLTNKPRWSIANHLERAIRQLEQYVWQDVRNSDGHFKQVPRKENDDACDALRYFMATYNQSRRKKKRIIGYTGGDPVTGYGRIPVYAEA